MDPATTQAVAKALENPSMTWVGSLAGTVRGPCILEIQRVRDNLP
jgi:hypothetical protein